MWWSDGPHTNYGGHVTFSLPFFFLARDTDGRQDGQERIAAFPIAGRAAGQCDAHVGPADPPRLALAGLGRRRNGHRFQTRRRPEGLAPSSQPRRKRRRRRQRRRIASRKPHPAPIHHHGRHVQVSHVRPSLDRSCPSVPGGDDAIHVTASPPLRGIFGPSRDGGQGRRINTTRTIGDGRLKRSRSPFCWMDGWMDRVRNTPGSVGGVALLRGRRSERCQGDSSIADCFRFSLFPVPIAVPGNRRPRNRVSGKGGSSWTGNFGSAKVLFRPPLIGRPDANDLIPATGASRPRRRRF